MRLLVLHDKPAGELGGMARFIEMQTQLLESAQWTVQTLRIGPPTTHAELPASGRRLGLDASRQLQRCIDHFKPDLALVHSVFYALGPWALLALQRSVPTVYLLHDVTPLCPRQTRLTREGQPCNQAQGLGCLRTGCYRVGESGRWASDAYGLFVRGLQTQAARQIQQWLVPSEYLAQALVQAGVQRERIAVLTHFLPDVAKASSGPGQPPPVSSVHPPVPGRLLYAGRLVEEKGLGRLLQALDALQAPHWTLHIAGDGPCREAWRDSLLSKPWQHRVHWCGALGEAALQTEYDAAEVVVMPSLIPESFGLSGLEALRQSRPVVGFMSGGMAEWLRPGDTGLVAEWGAPQALAQALDALLLDPATARRLGAAGRQVFEREFSAAQYLPRLQSTFEACIERHGRSAQQAPGLRQPAVHP